MSQDLVQETYLGALKMRKWFRGQSSEKTWMISILRHKIMDYYRAKKRMFNVTDLKSEDDPEKSVDEIFDQLRTAESLAQRYQGYKDLERKEFWENLHKVLCELPARQLQAFVLYEIEKMATDDVCEVLNMSPTNLWVTCHRAKQHLRKFKQQWALGYEN